MARLWSRYGRRMWRTPVCRGCLEGRWIVVITRSRVIRRAGPWYRAWPYGTAATNQHHAQAMRHGGGTNRLRMWSLNSNAVLSQADMESKPILMAGLLARHLIAKLHRERCQRYTTVGMHDCRARSRQQPVAETSRRVLVGWWFSCDAAEGAAGQ